ncbi:MAG: DUF1580 domain-containing protein [Pirellulales bacterium]|nr:DUF1580 domain-containing protein [Pirellulales bacterium]
MLPARRAGKRPHVSCLYRWSTAGCKGEVLETLQVGGTRCTSREALARFFRRLSRGLPADRPETPLRHARRRRREVAVAVRELEREGL